MDTPGSDTWNESTQSTRAKKHYRHRRLAIISSSRLDRRRHSRSKQQLSKCSRERATSKLVSGFECSEKDTSRKDPKVSSELAS